MTADWTADANGNWSAGGNWSGGIAATGLTGVAYFTSTISDNRTVTVNVSPWTINGLTVANSDPYAWTMAGGQLNLAGSTPTLAINNGTLVFSGALAGSGHCYVGAGVSGSGTMIVSNGAVLSLGGPGFWVNIGGKKADGTGDIGNGTLEIDGGSVSIAPGTTWFFNPYASAGGSTLNLNGGTLSMGAVITDGSGSGSLFNLNGGILQFPASMAQICNGTMSLNVLDGGAVFDTGTNTVTVGPGTRPYPLLSGSATDGGLIKLGSGTLTLPETNNSYLGPTTVSNGTLVVGGLTGGGPVTVFPGATLGAASQIAGPVTLRAGAALSAVSSTGSPLALGSSLTLNDGNVLTFGIGATPNTIQVGSSFTQNGTATIKITPLDGLTVGTYDLITGASGIKLANFTLATTMSRFTLSLTQPDSATLALVVKYAAGAAAYWHNRSGTLWTAASNWDTDASSGVAASSPPGPATVVFFAANAATAFNTILGADFSINNLTFSTPNNFTIGGTNALALGSGLTVASGAGSNTISVSQVSLGADQKWTVTDAGTTLWVGSAVGGSGALTVSGLGTVSLSGTNTYGGSTTVSNATLNLAPGGALSSTNPVGVVSGGTLVVSGSLTDSGHCYIGAGATGSGTMIVSNGAVVSLGGTGFWVNIGGKKADGSGSGGNGTLEIDGGSVSIAPGTIWYFNPYGGAGPATLNLNGGTLNMGDVITDGAGSGSKFNLNGGTLRFTAPMSTICNGNMSLNVMEGGAIFDTGTNDVTVGPGTTTYPLISGSGPDGGLTKLGSGTLTLPEDNTYTGPTTVSNGTLVVGSLSGGGPVMVFPGTKLAPEAHIAGPVTLMAGAALSAVGSTGSPLILDSDLALNNNNVLTFAIGATPNTIQVGSAFTQNGTATINITPLGGFTVGTYDLITAASGINLANFTLATTISGFNMSLTKPNSSTLSLVVSSSAPSTAFWHNRSGTLWTAASNWDTDASSGVAVSFPPGLPTAVTFAANAATAFNTILGADFAINNLTFSTPNNVMIGGTNALALGSGLTVTSGAGSNTISVRQLSVTANQTWTIADPGTILWIGSAIGGSGALTVTGSGTLGLSGTSTNSLGGAIFDATTLNLAPGGALKTIGPVGAVDGGALTISGSLTASGHFYVGSGVAGSGTVDFNNGAVAKLGGAGIWVNIGGKLFNGQGAIGNGTLNINGGSVSVAPGTIWYFNPYGAAGASTLNLNGGTLSMGDILTDGAGSGSSFNLNGGTLQFPTNTVQICNGTMYLKVLEGGAIFDTGPNNVTIGPGTSRYPLVSGATGTDGGVTKLGNGTLTLPEANTYNGGTTVSAGTLSIVNTTGSGTGTGAVTVRSNATLAGSGFISGPVTVQRGGALSPGKSVGSLTINNDLTLAGNLFIELNKSASPSNDLIVVTGTLNNTGTGVVTVTNLGTTALAAGDRFHLFNQSLLNGQALTISPAPGIGLAWTNNLALDGSIAVVSGGLQPVPATNLTIVASGPASFKLSGKGGVNQAYGIYASTNVAAPMANWWLIGSTNADAGGTIQFLDTHATNQHRFYRFGQ
ncbi:MAG: autotransporter-associated beta strand repeat-containing protein [Verrucomicrobiota bacterium]